MINQPVFVAVVISLAPDSCGFHFAVCQLFQLTGFKLHS